MKRPRQMLVPRFVTNPQCDLQVNFRFLNVFFYEIASPPLKLGPPSRIVVVVQGPRIRLLVVPFAPEYMVKCDIIRKGP